MHERLDALIYDSL